MMMVCLTLYLPLLTLSSLSFSLSLTVTLFFLSNKSAVKKQRTKIHKTEHNKNGKINFHKKLSLATSKRKLIFAVKMVDRIYL